MKAYHLCLRQLLPLAALSFALTSCGTPEPVRDLAEVTAANVSLVNTSLVQLAQDSETVAVTRAEAVKDLDRRVTAARKELKLKLIAVDRAGQSDVSKTYDQLATLLKDLEDVEKEGLENDDKTREAALGQLMTASRTQLTVRSEPLTATSQAISSLAKDDDFKAQVKFYAKFIKGVVDDVEAAMKASDEAKAAAESAAKATGALNSARDVSRDDLEG